MMESPANDLHGARRALLWKVLIVGGIALFLIGFSTLAEGGAEPTANRTEEMALPTAPEPCPVNGVVCNWPTDDAELQKLLTPEQYRVVRMNGTERPFRNAFWNHKEPGLYVDVVSGEALFASVHKFRSGTGWPSFTQPVEKDAVVRKTDRSLGMVRTEVRSTHADSHLGHVFRDGPRPFGLRYCINSAALRFVPLEKLEEQGYGEYLALFSK